MNISSLPSEVLADIVGRLDYGSVESTLQLNKKFNNVVERYKLYKPFALTLEFSSKVEEESVLITGKTVKESNYKRRKGFCLRISNKNIDETINDEIAKQLKKFRLIGVAVIDMSEMDVTAFNIVDVLAKSNIPLSHLSQCYTLSTRKLPFVTKEFMDQLVAKNKSHIYFRNCETSLNLEDVFGYIRKYERTQTVNALWHFGVLDIPLEAQQDAWRILRDMRMQEVVKERFREGEAEHMIVETYKGTFMWQYTDEQRRE